MAAGLSSSTIELRERSAPSNGADQRLVRWVVFSLCVHGVLIAAMVLVPYLPNSSPPKPVAYTVDLVGGERIGATNFGTSLKPSAGPERPVVKPAMAVKEPVKAAPPPPPERKVDTKESVEKKAPKVEKSEPKEKTVTASKAVAIKEPKKDPKKAQPTKADPKEKVIAKAETADIIAKGGEETAQQASLDQVRERLMRSAVENAKNRGDGATKGSGNGKVLSQGAGEGVGASALGPGGRGGPGIVRGMDFLIYRNRMLETIKGNWAWPGQRGQIKVVVGFAVRDNGDIIGLKIVTPSGDPSFDESVLRALKKSSPLPPPPTEYRKDFSNVEVTFRPQDLGA